MYTPSSDVRDSLGHGPYFFFALVLTCGLFFVASSGFASVLSSRKSGTVKGFCILYLFLF